MYGVYKSVQLLLHSSAKNLHILFTAETNKFTSCLYSLLLVMVGFVCPTANHISTVNVQKPALEMTVFCCKEHLYLPLGQTFKDPRLQEMVHTK